MTKELPTVLEFLTLSLSAGESILDALRRIARISRGELAAELSTVSREVSTGIPLTGLASAAVRAITDAAAHPEQSNRLTVHSSVARRWPRCCALQAQDARDSAKRELLELSGKKEVAMLVPLVFLILPITIAVAIFRGSSCCNWASDDTQAPD